MASGHELAEHTAEVAVTLWADTLSELFAEAARALANVMAASPAPSDGPAERVHLEASDCDALLVDWLNELLYLGEVRRRVYTEVEMHDITKTSLWATVRGPSVEGVRLHVKAATFHGLHIERGASGYTATVILDV